MSSTISLESLSAEDRQKLITEALAQEAQKNDRIKDDRKTYKKLVDETIPVLFYELLGVSANLSAVKTKIYQALQVLIQMKADAYGKQTDQISHSFTTTDGITLIVGYRMMDNWDDTVTAGITKVNTFLEGLGKDKNSKILVKTVLKLLSQDSKGTLKASRVLQLMKIAEETGDTDFIDGVNIILQASKPIKTKEFVTCLYRDNNGDKTDLPLDICRAEFDFVMPAAYPIPVAKKPTNSPSNKTGNE